VPKISIYVAEIDRRFLGLADGCVCGYERPGLPGTSNDRRTGSTVTRRGMVDCRTTSNCRRSRRANSIDEPRSRAEEQGFENVPRFRSKIKKGSLKTRTNRLNKENIEKL
jgi:hypothetical protein